MNNLGDITLEKIDGEVYLLIGLGNGKWKKTKISEIAKRNKERKSNEV